LLIVQLALEKVTNLMILPQSTRLPPVLTLTDVSLPNECSRHIFLTLLYICSRTFFNAQLVCFMYKWALKLYTLLHCF